MYFFNRNFSYPTAKSNIRNQSSNAVHSTINQYPAVKTRLHKSKRQRTYAVDSSQVRCNLSTSATTYNAVYPYNQFCFAINRKILTVILEEMVVTKSIFKKIQGASNNFLSWIRRSKSAGTSSSLC